MPRIALDLLEPERIGARLRQLRERSGLAQATVARGAGIAPSTLQHQESGRRLPSLTSLVAVCRQYQASPHWVLLGGRHRRTLRGPITADRVVVAQRVRELREAAGLAHHSVAEMAGIDTATLSHLEQGRGGSPELLARVCVVLDVSVDAALASG